MTLNQLYFCATFSSKSYWQTIYLAKVSVHFLIQRYDTVMIQLGRKGNSVEPDEFG